MASTPITPPWPRRPELARSLYGTLGEIGGDDPRALDGVLWGLAGIGQPTAEEHIAVARCISCCGLISVALRVLGVPAWEAVKQAVGVKISMRPKIREPRWTHPRFR